MEWLIIPAAVLLVFLSLRARKQTLVNIYIARPTLASPAEARLLAVLRQSVPRHAAVSLKVRLADVVDVHPGVPKDQFFRYFSKLSQKHLDFVVYARDTGKILGAIELDDRSHQRADRRKRDEFVDEVMKAAGVPLLRIRASRDYKVIPMDWLKLCEPRAGQKTH